MKKEIKFIKKLLKQRSNFERTRKILRKFNPDFQTLLVVEKNYDKAKWLNLNHTKLKLINCKTLLGVDNFVYVVLSNEMPYLHTARIIKKYKNGNVDVEVWYYVNNSN